MYRRGIVAEVDKGRCRVKVKLPDKQDRITGWLDVLQRNTGAVKDFSVPSVDELVALLMDERDEAGCVLGSLYTEQNAPEATTNTLRRVTFADGTVVSYDAGTVTVAGPAAVHIDAAGTVTVAPAVELAATLKVGAGTSPVALATPLSAALAALKAAIDGAVPVPLDGGAALKAALVAGVAAWPPSIAAGSISSD